MSSKPTVSEYMDDSVSTIPSDSTIDHLIERMKDSGYDGFPVCSGRQLVGYVEAKDIVLKSDSTEYVVSDIMETDYPAFPQDLGVQTAGRVMFREGKSEVPVIGNDDNLVGILTNTDIIRSQIERTTPRKLESLKSMLLKIHNNISIDEYEENVSLSNLTPSQSEVYRGELKGRKYEIQNGLAEPIVVVRCSGQTVIADGHHRAVSANNLDMRNVNAYVLDIKDNIDLGLIEQAHSQGLNAIEDIDVIEDEEHPHIEKIDIISNL